jgi:hypothetical protein
MQINNFKRRLSQVYLSLVPVWSTIFALGVGYISYKIYLPVWIINVIIMVISAWILGLHIIKSNDTPKKQLAVAAFFLIIPTGLTSMFFGLGPPPETPAKWVATATEQEIRFIMLIIAGVFITLGFAVLRRKLNNTQGSFYSMLGFAAIQLAMPLFIFNMIFWGAYLPQLFKIMTSSALEKSPDWFHPVRDAINLLTPVEIVLIYVGVAAFAASIKAAGWISKKASFIYITICSVAALITVFPYSSRLFPVPFFIVTIPAAPFVIAYFMGINLLRKAGS